MSFFNPVSLNKQFEVRGSAGSIDNYISRTQPTGFTAHKTSNYNYIFLSDLSLGTLLKNGRPPAINGIQTKVIVTPVNKNAAVVTFKTKLRFELILTFCLWIIITLFQLAGKQPIPVWITAVLFPGILIFFFLLYRIQEHVLQSKVEQYLKLYNGNPAKNS
ncbi:MAG: hypothetical protein JWR09_4553 [Mucilaginibacter sp.]|nr:hypothetical protein [Mucilaginibacter sp.]